MKLCDYGCGKEAVYLFQNGKSCCSKNIIKCSEIQKKWKNTILNPKKEKKNAKFSWIEKYVLTPLDEILDPYWKRKKVILEQNGKCSKCQLDKWFDQPLNLQIHHIDGNNGNWKRENVIALCPNCHSLTDNFSGKNINSGAIKVEDSVLRNALLGNKSIRQALLQCGLAPKGGNYDRAKRLKFENCPGGEMADTTDSKMGP
jgi:hypothetical protein